MSNNACICPLGTKKSPQLPGDEVDNQPQRMLHLLRSTSSALQRCQPISRRLVHTIAIAREIPDSFLDALVSHHSPNGASSEDVSLDLSRQQHEKYLAELRKHIPTLSLPPLSNHPDCLFVEDSVVAIGDTAVITQMGHPSRRREVDSIKEVLHQLGMKNMYDMREKDEKEHHVGEMALCDGGDVLFTGRHLFVGISDRTNRAGFRFLKRVFGSSQGGCLPEDNIIAVPALVAGKEVLHLKSAVTHLDERTLLAPEGALGDAVLQSMNATGTERGYTAVRLPDVLSCNAVSVNGHVLAQDAQCKVSKERIEKACTERDLGVTFVDTSELAKKDAALSCCCVLLSV